MWPLIDGNLDMSNDEPTGRSAIQTALLLAGTSGLLFILVFLLLGVVTPGYDPTHGTISALEFTAVGPLQQINFIVFGLLMVCFAVGLRHELRRGRAAVLAPTFQLVSACAVIGDGIFIYEPLHLICDLIAFNATIVMLFLFAWRFWSDPRWNGWAAYSIFTAVLMMAFLTAFGIANTHGGPAGTFEKLATATRTAWSILLVWKLICGRRLA